MSESVHYTARNVRASYRYKSDVTKGGLVQNCGSLGNQ